MTCYDYLYYFIEAIDVDIIVADFNIDACSKTRGPKMLSEYVQLVECPTHVVIFGYEIEIVVLNTYFSDHDAVRVRFQRKKLILRSPD